MPKSLNSPIIMLTGRSAVRLARSVRDAEVGGSNPLAPINTPNANILLRFNSRLIPNSVSIVLTQVGNSQFFYSTVLNFIAIVLSDVMLNVIFLLYKVNQY